MTNGKILPDRSSVAVTADAQYWLRRDESGGRYPTTVIQVRAAGGHVDCIIGTGSGVESTSGLPPSDPVARATPRSFVASGDGLALPAHYGHVAHGAEPDHPEDSPGRSAGRVR